MRWYEKNTRIRASPYATESIGKVTRIRATTKKDHILNTPARTSEATVTGEEDVEMWNEEEDQRENQPQNQTEKKEEDKNVEVSKIINKVKENNKEEETEEEEAEKEFLIWKGKKRERKLRKKVLEQMEQDKENWQGYLANREEHEWDQLTGESLKKQWKERDELQRKSEAGEPIDPDENGNLVEN